MAFLFDEVNDYISFSGATGISIGSGADYTISLWVKLTDNTGSLFQYLLSFGNVDANPSFQWLISEASNADPNELRFNLGDNDTTDTGLITSTGQPFASNTNWTHILLQRSGSTFTQYINGSADGATTNSSFGGMDSSSGATYIGRRADGDVDRYFGGSIAELAVWGRALNSSEIDGLKDGLSPLFYMRSIQMYAPLIRNTQNIAPLLGVAGTFTTSGATATDHPRIIYPSGLQYSRTTTNMTQTIELSGLVSTSALGSPSLGLNVTPSSVASISALGSPSFTQDNTITPNGLASTSALGTHIVARANSVDLIGLASTSAFGTPIIANTQIVVVSGLVSAGALGAPTISTTQSISLEGLASQSSIGAHSVNNVQVITFGGLPSTSAFGTIVIADLGFSLVTPTTGDFSYVPF